MRIDRQEDERVNLSVAAIELDTTIQCRADIDIATVNEYAEAMQAGDEFPPIDVFGTAEKCWIGDGWHRVMAARSAGLTEIAATLHTGGRIDALKHALSANALHGRRRDNKDKRRTVEIALREFGGFSNVVIAEMCGVSDEFVRSLRPPEPPTVGGSTRTGADGKEHPARRQPHPDPDPEPIASPKPGSYFGDEPTAIAPISPPLPKPGPSRLGMQYAHMAIMDLEQIRDDDLEREQAFAHIRGWLDEHA